MQARLAGSLIDTDLRPLVVAGAPTVDGGVDAMIRAMKDLVSRGADAILVDTVPPATGGGGFPTVTIVEGESRHDDGPLLRIGGVDCLIVDPDGLASASRRGPAVPVVVDLGTETDRAILATQVVLALESGAVGFITVAPGPVRRAAHVIRAVENAR